LLAVVTSALLLLRTIDLSALFVEIWRRWRAVL